MFFPMLFLSKLRAKQLALIFIIPAVCLGIFLLFNISAVSAAGPTYIYNDIDQPTTWTLDNSPYVITPGLGRLKKILIKAELTIEPGVVVKFQPNHWNGRYAALEVDGAEGGRLLASGTADRPIVFTSYYDNDYDTVVGNDKAPQKGDWSSLRFYADNSILEHVIVRYASEIYTAMSELEFHDLSQAQISHSFIELSNGSGAILDGDAKPVLDDVTFQHNNGAALWLFSATGPGILKNSRIQFNSGECVLKIDANSLFKFENNNYHSNQSSVNCLKGTANREVTWYNLGLPYLLRASVGPAGVVHIEPGTIFKFDLGVTNAYHLLIDGGRLYALGTADQPIIFTSWRDDSAGGDSNHDGHDTAPAPRDWSEIYFQNHAVGEFDYAQIRYGGEYHGDFSGVVFGTNRHNMLGAENSDLKVSHSKIQFSQSYGLLIKGDSSADLQDNEFSHNGTGLAVGSGLVELPVIKHNKFFDNSAYALNYWGITPQLDVTYNWWGSDSGPTHPDNPNGTGDKITGNVLYDPWLGKTQDLDPVIIVPGIMGSWNVTGEWELDPIMHIYDNLWEALKHAGYVEGQTLFAFPYQWRVSNELTAYDLMRKIDEIQQKTGKNKIDIIAHSMGGLVVRYYIENELYLEDNDNYDQIDIDQIIFLGTPHKGATKAYLTWEGGKMGPSFEDYIKERIFSVEADFNGYGSVFQYVQGLPMQSVKELLPIYDYLRDKDTGVLREYPNNYPRNEFLEELNTQEKLEKMEQVRGLNIIGKMGNDSTINILRVVEENGADGEWEHGYPEKFNNLFFGGDHGLEMSEGDRTVPNRSNNEFLDFKIHKFNFSHSNIVTEAQKLIIKELTGTEPDEFVRLNQFQKAYLVRIFSPVDFQVIDPQGRRIGKDFNNSQSINEIPNAFYSGFENGPEFVFVLNPLDGEYKIVTQATDNGKFDLSTSIISDNYAVDGFVYDIPVETGQQDIFISNLDTSSEEPILDLQPQDQTSPEITINSPQAKQYLHSDIIDLDYQITDDESGVAEHTQYLDDQSFNDNQIDLFFQALGQHTFTLNAKDRMHNSATSTVTFEVIATLDSLESDINRCYELGWIKYSWAKDIALQIVSKAKYWYNKYEIIKNTNPWLAQRIKSKLISKLNYLKTLLNFYQKLGYLNQQANDLLYKQVEYIINNL